MFGHQRGCAKRTSVSASAELMIAVVTVGTAALVHRANASTLWLSTNRKRLEHNGQTVFLNGVNLAWISCAPHDSSHAPPTGPRIALGRIDSIIVSALGMWLTTARLTQMVPTSTRPAQ
eukprot:6008463-Prymnesium_polylepis.2